MALGSFFVTSYMVVKGAGFMFGFVFFGDPILVRGAKYLNRRFPHWQKILELRKLVSLLRTVILNFADDAIVPYSKVYPPMLNLQSPFFVLEKSTEHQFLHPRPLSIRRPPSLHLSTKTFPWTHREPKLKVPSNPIRSSLSKLLNQTLT